MLQALYHLQRGPILGGVAGHPDERAALATLLLNSAAPLAARMLSPGLYLWDAEVGAFAAVEPVDIALLSGEDFLLLESRLRATLLSGGHASVLDHSVHCSMMNHRHGKCY